jgi:hypothetical protein
LRNLAIWESPEYFLNSGSLNKLFIDDISFDLRRSPKTTNDKADALLKWNDLLEKGAISQEEYDKAKRDLLG